MNNRKTVLFFGELSPGVIHGISLSNRLNIDLLQGRFNVETIEEHTQLSEHGKRSSSKFLRIFRDLKRIYRCNKAKRCDYFYTVFSLSSLGSVKTLAALIAYKLSGTGRTVLHLHRGDFEPFYQRSLVHKAVSKLVFRFVDTLVVLSQQQREHMAGFIERDKIEVLENSLNQEFQFEDKNVGDTNFLFISNYIREKGIYELLDVFSERKDLQLRCFGGFVNNQANIEAYGGANICVGNFINDEVKFEELHKADALILPSWNEGQPTIILEAMMVGTAVLVTRVGLIEELLGSDYPFYFDAQNKHSLSQCIDKFISYANKDQVSVALKQKYANEFCKDIHQQKLLNIFG